MKIIIVGDLHGDFQALNNLVESECPDIIFQVGDFGFLPGKYGWPPDDPPLRNGETRIYWCDGNHEDHQALSQFIESNNYEVAPNCFYQPRGAVLTLPDSRNVLFFGGAASGDTGDGMEGQDRYHSEVPQLADLDNIPSDRSIDIVVSHTAPMAFKIRQDPPLGYAKLPWLAKHHEETRVLLDEILHRHHPQQWYFGHFHIHQTGYNEGCRWTALAMPFDGGETWWTELGDG
ncbi:metallophosphoesterase family protein [Pseudodesulfovibrio indicus]|uniref:Icc-related predicted phosphoesterase n=1 Tax=Pseudodesulfovibrio indicus TaxID=1716143 RepID=A0A126QS42_9BACT|nr:metallophosphoesterase [Pseudodesulfovibrio indicus]AMK12692.1 hypothetical protein AWY79_17055 [Pseudodesulfovibrio indicus]TDT91012.1 Icc-related predicted phosphoesterase [Pseudodesulfovibrio indicus]